MLKTLIILLCTSDMGYAVVELGKLAAVPTVGGSYQITGDALQLVDVVAPVLWAGWWLWAEKAPRCRRRS